MKDSSTSGSQPSCLGSASVDIVDSDIATIEALHDLLLDAGYQLDFVTLKRARELTAKMYAALYPRGVDVYINQKIWHKTVK